VPGKDSAIYCSHGGIDKDSSVWGYDAVSTDRSLTVFRRSFMRQSSESKKYTLLKLYLRFLFPKVETASSSETNLFADHHGI
jgi:hypothetical protein